MILITGAAVTQLTCVIFTIHTILVFGKINEVFHNVIWLIRWTRRRCKMSRPVIRIFHMCWDSVVYRKIFILITARLLVCVRYVRFYTAG
jgi:hypothetical protein